MKVVTKYETLETKQMSNVEKEGVESIFNRYLKEHDLPDHSDLYYCNRMLQPSYDVYICEGLVNRLGMVNDRIVVEVNKLDEFDEPQDEEILFWLDLNLSGCELSEIEG